MFTSKIHDLQDFKISTIYKITKSRRMWFNEYVCDGFSWILKTAMCGVSLVYYGVIYNEMILYSNPCENYVFRNCPK